MATAGQRLRTTDQASAGGPPETVTTESALATLVDELSEVPRYALDTEFHRERTYWPRLALVQVAWRSQPEGYPRVALVDPLAVDPAPLAKVLDGPGVMVAHAASQDLEVLARACQLLPGKLFDTQIAAGFLGYGSASLASLVERFLGLRLAKGDRLTDWSRRPLTASQVAYAASDVAYLLELADVISEQLAFGAGWVGQRKNVRPSSPALSARPSPWRRGGSYGTTVSFRACQGR